MASDKEGLNAFEQFNEEQDLKESLSTSNGGSNETTAIYQRQSQPLPSFNYGEKIYVDIDNLCGEIFDELALIDDKFGFISDFFRRQAEMITAGREPEYLSEDETKTAQLYEILGVASSGLGNILKAADMEFKLRTEVYPRLKKIAKQKLKFVEQTLPQCEELMKSDWSDFSATASQLMQIKLYKENQYFYDHTWNVYIKNLRNSWFHFLYLTYFKALLNDWENDIFIATYQIPDMEDVNSNILYNLFSEFSDENNQESFSDKLKERIVDVMSGKWDFIKLKDVIVIKDKELLASLQTYCQFPFSLSVLGEVAQTAGANELLDDYKKNEAYVQNHNLRVECETSADQAKSRGRRVLLNGLLLTACCSLAVFSYFGTGWSIFWTIFFFIIFMWRCNSIKNGIKERYETKIDKIKVYAETVAHLQAGEGPKYRTITEVVEKKNKIWIGAILGFVIGLFAGGVGCIFGALIGAAIAGSFSSEEVESNGSDWNEVKTGKGLLSKIFMGLLIAVLAWEIVFFGIGRKRDIAGEPVDIIAVTSPKGMKMEDAHKVVVKENSNSEAELSEIEVKQILDNLWPGLPDHGMNEYTQASLSPSFYKLVDMGFSVPNDEPGGIGSGEDMLYWYTGNGDDGEYSHIENVKINNQSSNKIEASVTFDLGIEGQPYKTFPVVLIKSNDKWVFDDFNGKRKEIYKYVSTTGKDFTEGLAETILENPLITDYLEKEEIEDYRKEVYEFIKKFNKAYPNGKVTP